MHSFTVQVFAPSECLTVEVLAPAVACKGLDERVTVRRSKSNALAPSQRLHNPATRRLSRRFLPTWRLENIVPRPVSFCPEREAMDTWGGCQARMVGDDAPLLPRPLRHERHLAWLPVTPLTLPTPRWTNTLNSFIFCSDQNCAGTVLPTTWATCLSMYWYNTKGTRGLDVYTCIDYEDCGTNGELTGPNTYYNLCDNGVAPDFYWYLGVYISLLIAF